MTSAGRIVVMAVSVLTFLAGLAGANLSPQVLSRATSLGSLTLTGVYPRIFTPNGDGANDYFVVHGIERYPNNLFQVFNRWGDKVYELRNYQNHWNGQNMNGGSLPDATYFVILDINNGEIVLHGYVDMRR